MPLTDAQRRRAMTEVVSAIAADGPMGLTKDQVVAAVQGIDAYLDTNAAAMNTAIPQPARGALTARQKLDLFMAVARWRRIAQEA